MEQDLHKRIRNLKVLIDIIEAEIISAKHAMWFLTSEENWRSILTSNWHAELSLLFFSSSFETNCKPLLSSKQSCGHGFLIFNFRWEKSGVGSLHLIFVQTSIVTRGLTVMIWQGLELLVFKLTDLMSFSSLRYFPPSTSITARCSRRYLWEFSKLSIE